MITKNNNLPLTNESSVKLTAKQKIITIVSAILIFIISLLLFFPTESIVRHTLNKAGKASHFIVDFESFSFGFFGSTKIKNLHYISKSGSNIKVENVILDFSIFDLLSSEFDGKISLQNIKYYLKTGTLRLNLDGSIVLKKSKNKFSKNKKKFNLYNGKIKINIKQVILPPISGIPMLEETKKIFIKNISIDGKVRKNKFQTTKAIQVESDILSASIEGSINVFAKLLNSTIDLNICLKTKPKLFIDYPMAETVKMLPDYASKLCKLKVSGRLTSIKSNLKQLLKPQISSEAK